MEAQHFLRQTVSQRLATAASFQSDEPDASERLQPEVNDSSKKMERKNHFSHPELNSGPDYFRI